VTTNEVGGAHGVEYENYYLVGYDAVYPVRSVPKLQKVSLPQNLYLEDKAERSYSNRLVSFLS
jgi:hypothetical protein